MFHEELDELVQSVLAPYSPRRHETPIADHDELEVDWALTVGSRPFYLFGVRDMNKARLATIACQAFQLKKLVFNSVIVHEDMARLPKKDQVRITSAADKQFPSLDDFRSHGAEYFEREAQVA
jgi:hypothetical protein